MKKFTFAIACLFGIAVLVHADDTSDYQKYMKAALGEIGKLRANNTGSDAAEAAKKLASDFDDMQKFWEKRGASDAAGIAEKDKVAANDLEAAAKANDATKASAAMMTINGSCAGCHMAHRAKGADGAYMVK